MLPGARRSSVGLVIGFLVKTSIRALLLAVAMYVFFFVHVGAHTLYGHVSRISSTPEAQELGDDLSTVVDEKVIEPAKAVLEARPWDRLQASREAR